MSTSTSQKPNSARGTTRRRTVAMVAGIMVAVGLVDQVVKQIMVTTLTPGEPVAVIGDWFRWLLLFNSGAAFSMGQDLTWLITAIQLAFVIGALVFAHRLHNRWEVLGIALIAGGALGNLIDRLFRPPGFWFGHVVDYISVGDFAVFNLADTAINIGVAVFILALFFAKDEEDTAEKDES
ncbi:signal peptidase II [uncultured Corynebacterium sp.]|uniref:signal peptidase II n=1 Tax=uncultured Corynebacterium sp. TaxID=159447 RepID=UPI0025CC2E3B|nr:signal peptidase II [uncultured Corynebacterium sp.]